MKYNRSACVIIDVTIMSHRRSPIRAAHPSESTINRHAVLFPDPIPPHIPSIFIPPPTVVLPSSSIPPPPPPYPVATLRRHRPGRRGP